MGRPFQSPLARPSDPDTSSRAATAVVLDGTVTKHELMILAALRAFGERGGTASEVAAWVVTRHPELRGHFDNVRVARRWFELISRGQVERREVGQASCLPSAAGGTPAPRPWLSRVPAGKRRPEVIHWRVLNLGPLFDE